MSSYIISHIYTARQNESSNRVYLPLSSLKKTLRGCGNQKTLRMFLQKVGPIRPSPQIQTRELMSITPILGHKGCGQMLQGSDYICCIPYIPTGRPYLVKVTSLAN